VLTKIFLSTYLTVGKLEITHAWGEGVTEMSREEAYHKHLTVQP